MNILFKKFDRLYRKLYYGAVLSIVKSDSNEMVAYIHWFIGVVTWDSTSRRECEPSKCLRTKHDGDICRQYFRVLVIYDREFSVLCSFRSILILRNLIF